LPLPKELRVAVAPLHQEVLFNSRVLHLYLAYWIPALLVSIAVLKHKRPKAMPWACLTAAICGGMILCGYEYLEVLLRASGMLMPAMVIFCMLMVVLMALLLLTLEHEPGAAGDVESDVEKPTSLSSSRKPIASNALLSYSTTAYFAMTAAAVFFVFSYFSPEHKTFALRDIQSLKHSVLVAKDWKFDQTVPAHSPYPEVSIFSRRVPGSVSQLQVMSLRSDSEGVKKLMQWWTNFLHLKVINFESWDRYSPGAYAMQFSLPNADGGTKFAVSSFVPRDNGRTEVFTAVVYGDKFDETVSEIALLVQNLYLVPSPPM